MSFCPAKTQSCKTAGMPFYSSARDRSGILFCRRQKRYKRIARSGPQGRMRPNSGPGYGIAGYPQARFVLEKLLLLFLSETIVLFFLIYYYFYNLQPTAVTGCYV
jgi:hypothetical protein